MNSIKSKILKKSYETNESYSDFPNFSKEDFKKLKYPNNKTRKNSRKLSKFEWKLKCLIHRVKRRTLTFMCIFSDCDEV